MRLAAFVAMLGLACAARAQDATEPPAFADDTAPPEEPGLTCQQKWGCWDLMHTGRGTVLGAKLSLTSVGGDGPNALDASFLTVYSTEHYATHEHLALHFLAFGSLGAGTAGTESTLGIGLDFGWRAPVTDKSGPFLRGGVSAQRLGNDELRLVLFEPLQARAGYQWLDGDTLFEGGMTQGLVALGGYHPGSDPARSLDRGTELGGYAAARLGPHRGDVSWLHVLPPANDPGSDLDLVRAAFCNYSFAVALCGDVLFVRGESGPLGGQFRMRSSVYTGFTVGMAP